MYSRCKLFQGQEVVPKSLTDLHDILRALGMIVLMLDVSRSPGIPKKSETAQS